MLKPIDPEIIAKAKAGKKVLIVDDLVDTGATARVVRDMLPGAHFATVYAKPKGREMVDTFITEVSQDTWIFFPWDLDVAYVELGTSTVTAATVCSATAGSTPCRAAMTGHSAPGRDLSTVISGDSFIEYILPNNSKALFHPDWPRVYT